MQENDSQDFRTMWHPFLIKPSFWRHFSGSMSINAGNGRWQQAIKSTHTSISSCRESLRLYKTVVLGCLTVISVHFNVNVWTCEKALKGFPRTVTPSIWSCPNLPFRGSDSSSFSVSLTCMLNCSRAISNWCSGLSPDLAVSQSSGSCTTHARVLVCILVK